MKLAVLVVALAAAHPDPPVLVPWHRIGNIQLGEPRTQVEREYGRVQHGPHVAPDGGGDDVGAYLRLHGSNVDIEFRNGRVNMVSLGTPYYRTASSFGVGSKIPLGPCHPTALNPCEHRWHGFVYGAWSRDRPCSCWVKVGTGAKSLAVTGANFLKPWTFIYVRNRRVTSITLAWKFVD